MIKVAFVCHGNICRSPIAEILFKYMINNLGLSDDFYCDSFATSREEIGNPIYLPMRRVLLIKNIPFEEHFAKQISKKEIEDFDYIFFMDNENMFSLLNKFPGKKDKFIPITKYVKFNEIEDPWYTGRFEHVFNQIFECTNSIVIELKKYYNK